MIKMNAYVAEDWGTTNDEWLMRLDFDEVPICM
jgi:hypothetical protein